MPPEQAGVAVGTLREIGADILAIENEAERLLIETIGGGTT
jgi:hypothetical protein